MIVWAPDVFRVYLAIFFYICNFSQRFYLKFHVYTLGASLSHIAFIVYDPERISIMYICYMYIVRMEKDSDSDVYEGKEKKKVYNRIGWLI